MIEREQMPGEARPSCGVCGDIVGRRWMEERLSNKRWTAYCLAHAREMSQQVFHAENFISPKRETKSDVTKSADA